MPSSWKLGKNGLWADLRRIQDGCKGQVAEIPHIFTITELHINSVFFFARPKARLLLGLRHEGSRVCFLCVLALLNSPDCEHSWALVPSKADQRQQDFQHHIHGFAHVRTQTRTCTHMEIFPQKGKSFQVKRSLWGYQQCRLIDIFSVSLLVPSGIDKAEGNNNFPAWLPISRADGQCKTSGAQWELPWKITKTPEF